MRIFGQIVDPIAFFAMVLTGIAGLVGAVSGLWAVISQRRKIKAEVTAAQGDAVESVANAAAALVGPLREQIAQVAEESRQQKAEIERQAKQIDNLAAQVDDMETERIRLLALIRHMGNIIAALTAQILENDMIPVCEDAIEQLPEIAGIRKAGPG